MRIQIRQRKFFKMIECLGTNILHHPVGDHVVDMVHQPLCACCDTDHNCNFSEDYKKSCKIHLILSDNQIHTVTDQNRSIQRRRHSHSRKHKRQQDQPFVNTDVIQNPLECGFVFSKINFLLCHLTSPPLWKAGTDRSPYKSHRIQEALHECHSLPSFHRREQRSDRHS